MKEIATLRKRDLSIDIVRSICMVCIILAHVNPPIWLHTLRSFDVVGLVMISTICMKPYTNFKNYCQAIGKRIERLVIPAYIFIVCVLLSAYLLCLYLDIPYIYDKTNIINAFLLIDGIGYVWIIRILLINALLTPILFKLAECRSIYVYIGIILFLILLKVLFMMFPYNGNFAHFVFNYFILYSAGYFGIALYTLVLKKSAYKTVNIHLIAGLIILLSYKILCNWNYGDDLFILEKHPPMLDWLVYGVLITDILLIISKKLEFKIRDNNILLIATTWFSINSFQIYFIHAWLIIMFNIFSNASDTPIIISWWLKFILVFLLSILIKILYDMTKMTFRKNIRHG